jgi:hypothetical protein
MSVTVNVEKALWTLPKKIDCSCGRKARFSVMKKRPTVCFKENLARLFCSIMCGRKVDYLLEMYLGSFCQFLENYFWSKYGISAVVFV